MECLFCLQDVTDFEWEFWLSAVKSLMPAMLLHTIGGIIFSRFLSQVRNDFSVFVTYPIDYDFPFEHCYKVNGEILSAVTLP